MSVCLYVCLSLSIDSCKKSAVVFDEAIASFDVINCQSVQAQVCASVCLSLSLSLSFRHIWASYSKMKVMGSDSAYDLS